MKSKYLRFFACLLLFVFLNIKPLEIKAAEISEDYPVVSMMENKVLGSSFQKEDIYKRLDRLEIKLFGAVSNKSLSDRVDFLSSAVLGESENPRDKEDSEGISSDDSYSADNPDQLNDLLFQLEKQLLNQTYPNDDTETRISRLESNIFNEKSDNYPIEERINRVAAVVKAEPSNELYKDMAQLKNYQDLGQGVSLAALLIMIIVGIIL